ncbi:hypothetical protein AXF42_Ash000428 [Apostasia shenzhenica]|uniref:Uncharacterized protein n=1 Tax=Apostasia shenzhenica TaxID=1088818 RepID=A0A2I0AGB7_9ASPA|nr:hypothetical protein AXF42_Ash000428 [Apostasia shenzhenica]
MSWSSEVGSVVQKLELIDKRVHFYDGRIPFHEPMSYLTSSGAHQLDVKSYIMRRISRRTMMARMRMRKMRVEFTLGGIHGVPRVYYKGQQGDYYVMRTSNQDVSLSSSQTESLSGRPSTSCSSKSQRLNLSRSSPASFAGDAFRATPCTAGQSPYSSCVLSSIRLPREFKLWE